MPGTLSHSPADVLRRVLIGLGLGTDPAAGAAWPIYAGGEPDTPDSAITVYDTQGRDHGREMATSERQEIHGVQVRVRASAHTVGYAKARAVAVALDGVYLRGATIGSTGYLVRTVVRVGDVIALGKESPASKRSLFTVNALVSVRQV